MSTAMGNGMNSIGEFGAMLLKSIGEFLVSLGEALVAAGVATVVAETELFTNPWAAIAAGAAGEGRLRAFTEREERKNQLREALCEDASADQLIAIGIPVKRDSGKMPLFDWLRFPDVALSSLLDVSRETAVATNRPASKDIRPS